MFNEGGQQIPLNSSSQSVPKKAVGKWTLPKIGGDGRPCREEGWENRVNRELNFRPFFQRSLSKRAAGRGLLSRGGAEKVARI